MDDRFLTVLEVFGYLTPVLALATLVVIAIRLGFSVAGLLGMAAFALYTATSVFWIVFDRLQHNPDFMVEVDHRLLIACSRVVSLLASLLLLACFATVRQGRVESSRPPLPPPPDGGFGRP